MIDFALIDGDLFCDEGGNLSTTKNEDCITQMIVCALKLFIGEYEYNTSLGIPWVIAMEYGYTQIPLLQYKLQNTIFSLNDYISNPNLKIIDIIEVNTNFNSNRELIIELNILLASNQTLKVKVNV